MSMTAETLAEAMGRRLSLEGYRSALPGFVAALRAAECTTVRRAAMFCAQVGHESLGLHYQREVWGPTAQQRRYEPGTSLARQLGNVVAGDGRRYMGRGRIQLTGRANYAAFGRWARTRGLVDRDDTFVRNPDLVAALPWCDLAAAWYWTVARPRINTLADVGDVVAVTRQINGGTHGLADRRRRYGVALRLGDRLLPGPAGPRTLELTDPLMHGEDVRALQVALRFPPERRDGIFGRDTERAVRARQHLDGLVTDGRVGPATRRAWGL